MNNRAKEYRLLFDEIISEYQCFKAQQLELLEPDEWRQLRNIIANVLAKIEPREAGLK